MNRMLKTMLAGLMLLPALSQAEGLSYKYIDLGYSQTELDDFDADGDAFSISGAFALAANWHIFGAYADGSGDVDGFSNVDIDITSWNAGLGYNRSLNDKIDFVGRVSYVKSELEGTIPGLGTV